jgi:hypothetical protein
MAESDKDYSVASTEKGFSYWLAQPFLDEASRREASSADLLLIPQMGFSKDEGPLFPVGTEELFAFFKERATPSGCKVDICISDSAYRELALHGEVLVICEIVVKYAFLPVALNLLADFIGQHLWSSVNDRRVRLGITVDTSEDDHHQQVKIAYEGQADDFAAVMRSATDAVQAMRIKNPK